MNQRSNFSHHWLLSAVVLSLSSSILLFEAPTWGQVHVVPLDSETHQAAEQELKGNSHFKLQPLPEKGAPAPQPRTEAPLPPDPILREKTFQQAGITPYVRKWDSLDRDLLWIRASSLTAHALIQKYQGKIPEKALKKLKNLQSHPSRF